VRALYYCRCVLGFHPPQLLQLCLELSGSRTALLSEERWQEMDWDKDGCITFKVRLLHRLPLALLHAIYCGVVFHQEFLSAMYEWVGVEE
jgi:hypothetical protein